MSAKECAEKDIKRYLRQEGKVFMAFIEELNPIMDSLTEEYIEEQGKKAHKQ